MAKETVFEGVLTFLEEIGVFRVILPFILVFVIVYALLERTRVLGTDKIGGTEISKKNLNAMVAFVSAFLVIISSKLVSILNQTIGQVMLVLIVLVLFLMLAGSFHKETKEAFFLENKGWRMFLIVVSFVSVALIVLEAIPGPDDEPFLEWFFEYMADHWNTEWVGSIILIVLIILFMWWIAAGPKNEKDSGKEGKKEGE